MTNPNCIEIIVNHFRQLDLSVQEAAERLRMDEQDIAIMYTELDYKESLSDGWQSVNI